jgi:hypothetical protein
LLGSVFYLFIASGTSAWEVCGRLETLYKSIEFLHRRRLWFSLGCWCTEGFKPLQHIGRLLAPLCLHSVTELDLWERLEGNVSHPDAGRWWWGFSGLASILPLAESLAKRDFSKRCIVALLPISTNLHQFQQASLLNETLTVTKGFLKKLCLSLLVEKVILKLAECSRSEWLVVLLLRHRSMSSFAWLPVSIPADRLESRHFKWFNIETFRSLPLSDLCLHSHCEDPPSHHWLEDDPSADFVGDYSLLKFTSTILLSL